MPKITLDAVKSQFPLNRTVEFTPGRATKPVRAVVTGYREAGTPGTRGHSVFLETTEQREGNLKARERSIRPGTATLV